jgi:rhomboid family GlyGly-CTERM serine protease
MATAAMLFDHQLSENLTYQRTAVDQGEWWRLFSAHFFHTNVFHYLLNTIAVVLLWGLHGHVYTSTSYLITFFLSGLCGSLGVHFWTLDLEQYVGLSGALHGIFVWGVVQEIKRGEKLSYLLMAGIVLKLLYEQTSDGSSSMADLINARIAVDAHLWGAFGGLLAGFIFPSKIRSHEENRDG